ncbi:DUF6850 family outer membrane beta-barrel protein [Flavobacterium sp. '19STA2R22 D10 B1']|uniref:DUF6850 family outer membrane beta-barrel protein n=1 Tax=Flavobacterium aerium TaxID=3037261 RepID=UPI00278C5FD0|nr:DUF6850 family outer membrane beta-barrel protein [Flavobacterium sp. '19STA2R22 D10 B1']
MTSKKVILFFILLISCALQAQLTDSLSIKENSFYNDVQVNLWKNPLFYTSQYINDFTLTQIDFKEKKLALKRVQTAEKTQEYTFSTQGVFNINPRLRLFGEFVFNRTNEYDLGYNFTTKRTENQNVLSPNYFYAPKKGNWEIQNYNLNGGFSYQFENNLLLGATVFYKNGKSFRTIDPRPEIISIDYGGEIHFGYTYQKHSIYTSIGISKRTENQGILYVNEYQNAPVYPETFTRFSSGYGRVIFNSSYTKYLFNTIDKNFGLGYQYKEGRNSINMAYQYNKSMESTYRRNNKGYIYVANELKQFMYRIVSHTAQLNYFHDGNEIDYKMSLDYDRQKGDNYSVIENGQNYRMNLDRFTFNSGIIKKIDHRVLYSFELQASYIKHKYIDLLGSTDKRLSTLEIEASFNKDIFLHKKNKLNLEFSVAHYSALDEKLKIVPLTANTSFSDNVIIPDHAYDVTSKLRSSMMAQYFYNLSKTKTLRFFANYSTLVALGDQYKNYATPFNTKESTYLNAGISIIY